MSIFMMPTGNGAKGYEQQNELPRDPIVFAGDGRKALFLHNAANEKIPNLKTEQVFVDHNPAPHDQGTNKPGRLCANANSGGQRGAVASPHGGRSVRKAAARAQSEGSHCYGAAADLGGVA